MQFVYFDSLNKTTPQQQLISFIHHISIFLTFPSLVSFSSLSCKAFHTTTYQMDTQFHVLAVDDSIIDRKLIERLLKTSSFQVTAVDSPNKALELLGLKGNQSGNVNNGNDLATKINMIITDYSMPGMTGYELLRKIKESERLRDIPVVIMSSENIPSRINRCLQDGAEEFFLKPVRLSDVDKLKPHLLRSKVKDFCKFQHRFLLNWYPDCGKLFQSCV